MNRNPKLDVPLAVAFGLASVASCFAMGAALGGWLYDKFHPSTEEQ